MLSIVVGPFDPFARDLDLVIDERGVGQLEEASVTDWNIHNVAARIVPSSTGDPADRRFRFEVQIARRSTFYIWRVLLPMTLLVVASWTVFWFEVTNLQPQISTCLAILLSLVTFNYAIDFSLPKVPYLTLIDRFGLTCFGYVLLGIFAVSATHFSLHRFGPESALRLQSWARWIFPTTFLVAVVTMVVFS